MQKELTLEKTEYISKNEKSFEFELDFPEYMPGLSKLICCDVVCENLNISEDSLEAQIKICQIYASDFDSRIKSVVFREKAALPFQNTSDIDTSALIPSCYITNVSSKALSSRKVSVKFTLCYSLSAVVTKDMELFDNQDLKDICTNTKEIEYCTKNSLPEQHFDTSSEINIGEGQEMGEIVFCRGEVSDIKAVCDDGKLDFEFNLNLSCLYQSSDDIDTQEGSFALATSSVKVSDTLCDSQITNECLSCLCVDILGIEAASAFDSLGENKLIRLNVKYSVGGFLHRHSFTTVVTDAFSTDFEADIEYEKLIFDEYFGDLSNRVSVSEVLRGDTAGITEPFCCNVKILSVSNELSQDKYFAVAKCCVKVLGIDQNGGLSCTERNVKLHIPLYENTSDARLSPNVYLNAESCSCHIKNGEIICDFLFSVCGIMLREKHMNVVKDLVKDTQKAIGKNKGELIIYYPTQSDTLWSVAKKYRVNPDTISQMNGLENGSISGKSTLVIC